MAGVERNWVSAGAAPLAAHVAANGAHGIYTGAASPEGAQVAAVGSLYLRTGGGPGTAVYLKESGAGNVGWKPIVAENASAAYTPSNVVVDRTYDANATNTDELADVLGTLIADLQAAGILG